MKRVANDSGLDRRSKDAYWVVVKKCLEKFHGVDAPAALEKAATLRSTIEAGGEGSSGDMIYHAEPFYVACDLAGLHEVCEQEKVLRQHAEEYRSIVKLHR